MVLAGARGHGDPSLLVDLGCLRLPRSAFVKLDPRHMIRVPVRYVIEIGSVITTVEFIAAPSLFVGLISH